MEALAVNATETASRMAGGYLTGGSFRGTHAIDPHSFPTKAAFAISPWGRTTAEVPGLVARGPYTIGAELVLYVREKLGEAQQPYSVTKTLFERMAESDETGWTPDRLGALAGLSGDDLLDEFTLASVAGIHVSAEDAAREGLPKYVTWTERHPIDTTHHEHHLERGITRSIRADVARGSYHFWYVLPGTPGVSLRIEEGDPQARWRLRLTRIS